MFALNIINAMKTKMNLQKVKYSEFLKLTDTEIQKLTKDTQISYNAFLVDPHYQYTGKSFWGCPVVDLEPEA